MKTDQPPVPSRSWTVSYTAHTRNVVYMTREVSVIVTEAELANLMSCAIPAVIDDDFKFNLELIAFAKGDEMETPPYKDAYWENEYLDNTNVVIADVTPPESGPLRPTPDDNPIRLALAKRRGEETA